MKRIFKADFYRLFHDRLFLPTLYISICLSLAIVISNYILRAIMYTSNIGTDTTMISIIYSGQATFFQAASPISLIGIITAIMSSIMICKDFQTGAIRNKLVSGCKRRNIVISFYLTQLIFGILIIGVYLLIIMIVGFLILGVGTSITYSFILSVLGTYFLTFITYATFLSAIVFFSISIKKVGISILLYIVFILIISSVTSVFSMINIININDYSPIYQCEMAGILTGELAIKTLVSNVLYILFFNLLSFICFHNCDVK